MFHLIFGLPWLYVVSRTIWPLPWPTSAKIAVSLLLLVASQFHYLSRLSSGSIFNPEFPRPVIMMLNWGFAAIALLAALQTVLDVATLFMTIAGHGGAGAPPATRYAIMAAAGLLAAIGVAQAVRVPPLRDIAVVIPGLPKAFDGYALIQLTDLHISRLFTANWTRSVVEATNHLGADLVVITGDVIDGGVAARRDGVEPLRALHARDGVFVIPGNHEYLSGYDGWMEHLASLGMRILPNAHAVILRGADRFVLAGVTDPSARAVNRPLPDLERALAGAPYGAPIILLDHEPRMAPHAAASGVALQLSGHTHGGMVFGLDRVVARANGGFVSGRYEVAGMTLYVSNGTGIWPGFALRLGRPSELTRITLRTG